MEETSLYSPNVGAEVLIKHSCDEYQSNASDPRLLLISNKDNVLVARTEIKAEETILVSGEKVHITDHIAMGHKLARMPIKTGDKIFKYGAPVGSAVMNIQIGEHVHLHNIKSDYTPTQYLDKTNAQLIIGEKKL